MSEMMPKTNGSKRFLVALSFPGEIRAFVEAVAGELSAVLGKARVLYDRFYEAEFAKPNLDLHLQRLYHADSNLIVVFLSRDYVKKEWPGLEWRAIRDLIKRRREDAVMLFRFDDAEVPGLFSTDGYVSAAGMRPKEAAQLILQRLLPATGVGSCGSVPPCLGGGYWPRVLLWSGSTWVLWPAAFLTFAAWACISLIVEPFGDGLVLGLAASIVALPFVFALFGVPSKVYPSSEVVGS